MVSGELFIAWQALAELLVERTNTKIFEERRLAYFKSLKVRFAESIFRFKEKVKDFSEFVDMKIGKNHHEIASTHRQSKFYRDIDLHDFSILNVSQSKQ